MDVGLGLSIGLGVTLAVLNTLASFLIFRRSVHMPVARSIAVVMGGMVVRLFLMLGLVALVVWLLPVQVTAFVLSLIVTFMVGLAIEVAYIYGRYGGKNQH